MKRKVAIIGTAGVPARYGGFETLAHHLVSELNSDFDLHVYASSRIYKKDERVKFWNNARVHYIPLKANGISSVIYDVLSMIHALFVADTFIILGVSGGVFIPFIKMFTRKKIIVNIDGLEWRREKWSKKAKKFLRFSEKLAVKYSHADITDNLAIKRYTSIHYKTVSYLIAYGGDHVSHRPLSDSDHHIYPFLGNPYAFKVARIEPENNVKLILQAFSKSNYPLVIVGNWSASKYGMDLKKEFDSFENIHLIVPIYDQNELDLLRSNCSFYVHGHSAGGTNPSLVEAMSLGLPIMAYDVSFNRETTKQEAIYFETAIHLQKLLDTTDSKELELVGKQMKRLAAQHYTWQRIANEYKTVIQAFDFNYVKRRFRRNLTNRTYISLVKDGYAHLNESKQLFDHIKQ